jgi:hypothetical protein
VSFSRRFQRQNGISPPLVKRPDPAPKEHMRWCVRMHVDSPELCTCDKIPTLRCVGCLAVFRPAIGETPEQFQARVLIHAQLHPDGEPGWETGTVETPAAERPPLRES